MKLKQLHDLHQRQTGLSQVNTKHALEMELLLTAPAIIELYKAANRFLNTNPRDLNKFADAEERLRQALKALEQYR